MAPASKNRTTPVKKAVEDAAQKLEKMNSKGEIIRWSARSDDGRLLKMLIENGNISPNMTAGEVRTKYTMFAKYSYSCFASALSNSRKSFKTHVKARGTPESKYPFCMFANVQQFL